MKKALIIHVGNNYSRSVKSIEKIDPDLVYFIYNETHENFMEKIINESPFSFEKRECLIEDFQSIKESYEKSKQIFKELKNENYEIHVGVSNGTKAMVVGLSLASVGYDCEFSYVGSVKGGRDEAGNVIEGGEKVFEEFHPMKQLATIEINRAKRYFNNYQFSESLSYFRKAKKASYNVERMEVYIKIVKLYQCWDKFENMIPYINKKNENSETTLDHYLRLIKKEIDDNENLKEYFYKYEADFMNQIDNNILFLKNKISFKGTIKKGDIYYYLPDLLNNALRRIDEEKFDDATARLYRITELIAQIRLYEHGIIEEKRLEEKKVFHIEKEDIVRNYPMNVIEYISKNRDFQNSEKKTVKLALSEDYELLKILGDELAIKFLDDKDLNNVLAGRNNSILAHGFVPSIEKNTNELFDRLIEYAQETFDNLDNCMKYSEFPKFKDIYD